MPSDAKVTINGLVTKTTGSIRQFLCDDLLPDHTYRYEVKAEIVRGGKAVTEVQTVVLTAGERAVSPSTSVISAPKAWPLPSDRDGLNVLNGLPF